VIDTLFAPELVNLAGLWVGLAVSLLVFSTILGDHWAARLGQHLLVGAGLGYAGAVVWQALRQSLLVAQLSTDPGGYWWHWIAVALLALFVAGALGRIVLPPRPAQAEGRLHRWLRWGGWLPAAFLAAAALAIGAVGAIQGTLAPQLARAATTGLPWGAPLDLLLGGALTLLITTGALLFFTVDPVQHLGGQPIGVRRIMGGWLWIGQRAVWLAAGVIFARLFASRISLLLAQFEYWAATFLATGIGQQLATWWGNLFG
jgi:hypothetical protein